MPDERADLTVSVVSHGHGAMLERLLHDLERCDAIRRLIVIVTLNVPGEHFDRTRHPNLEIEIIQNESPRGFGTNHNAAFARCRTSWFAILNPDLRLPDAHTLDILVQAAEKSDGRRLIAPVVRNSDGEIEDAVRLNLTPWSLLQRARRRESRHPDVSHPATRDTPFYWLAGMCLLAGSDAFRRVGGFDQRYFLYCEDYDLCARFINAGMSVAQVAETFVVHDAQRDSHRSGRHLRMHLASLARVWCSAAFWRVSLREMRLGGVRRADTAARRG